MSDVGRLLMKGHLHYSLHLLFGDSARLARARRILLKSCDPACQEATAPTRYLLFSQVHPSGNLLVFHTIGGQQYDARPFHQSHRHGAGPRHSRQGLSLFRVQSDRRGNPHTVSSIVWTRRDHNNHHLRRTTLAAVILVGLLLCTSPLFAQRQKCEPLTDAQIEQVREAGLDPVGRVNLYTKFIDEHAEAIKLLSDNDRSGPQHRRLDSTTRAHRLDEALLDMTALMDELASNLDTYSDRHADIAAP